MPFVAGETVLIGGATTSRCTASARRSNKEAVLLRSTLASVINCVRIIQSLKAVGRVVICSDTYHQPRCLWLFRLMGMKAESSPIPSGRHSTGLLRWLSFQCREVVAIPADSIYLLLFRYLGIRVAGTAIGSMGRN